MWIEAFFNTELKRPDFTVATNGSPMWIKGTADIWTFRLSEDFGVRTWKNEIREYAMQLENPIPPKVYGDNPNSHKDHLFLVPKSHFHQGIYPYRFEIVNVTKDKWVEFVTICEVVEKLGSGGLNATEQNGQPARKDFVERLPGHRQDGSTGGAG